jgi:ParB-like chromosome segregation protein Spo0J
MTQEATGTLTEVPQGSVDDSAELPRNVVATGSLRNTTVSLDHLRRGPVLRVMGEDQTHARLLAFTPVPLPPILVERSSMRVIDGMHRVLAARLRGETTIDVCFFDGNEADAFVAAVQANIEHGKPLSLADREHAAERIMSLHADWSDRVIGETCGLSPKTVAGIRRRTTTEHPQLHTRMGKDGRSRPLDPVPGRQRIAQAVIADPGASLQQIAVETGTSVGTVRDVRRRLTRGESPIPARCNSRSDETKPIHPQVPAGGGWTEDTACAATEDARRFARWFDSNKVAPEDCEAYVNAVPLSRSYAIIAQAQERARVWTEFATALETRARKEASAANR